MEIREQQMIEKLKQSINDHSIIVSRSQAGNLEDLKQVVMTPLQRSRSHDFWRF
jgi:hypothetical protein